MKATLLIAALASSATLAQENRVEELAPGTLSLRTGIVIPSIPLELAAEDGAGLPTVKYEQNMVSELGLGADYWIAGFFVSFIDLEPDKVTKEYGKTKYFDLQLHTSYDAWVVDLYYQRFTGYYWDQGGGEILQRSDLKSYFAGINALYVISPERISFAAASSATAIQRQSGGSWVLMANYGDQRLSSDSVLAPTGGELLYGRLGNMRRARFQMAGLGGGYAYTWAFESQWFIHGAMLLTLGPQWLDYDTRDFGSFTGIEPAAKGNARFAFGYNTRDLFFGVSIISDGSTYEIDKKTLLFTSLYSSVFFGLRTNIGSLL